MMLDDLFAVS